MKPILSQLPTKTRTFSGKLYLDKSFTIGIVPKQKVKKQDREYERSVREQPDVDAYSLTDWLTETASIKGKFCSFHENPQPQNNQKCLRQLSKHDEELYREMEKVKDGDYSKFYDATPPDASPLFIESPKSSRNLPKAYGEHGITGYGKRVVKNGSLILEQKYSKSRLGFVTCTLPSFAEEHQRAINANWSEVTRRFYQKLKRQLAKISKPFIYTGVTEIQEKRFKKYGLPVPHLHFVYLCRDSSRSRYWLYVCQIHRAWNEALREVSKKLGYRYDFSDENKLASVHCKCVRKSSAGYLGKYISKGCKVVESMKEQGFHEFPKQWWTASMQLKLWFKLSIKKLSEDMCKALFNDAQIAYENGVLLSFKYVTISLAGIEKRVGISGILSEQAYVSLYY